MDSTEINFKNGNPGAVRYGNFINYYKFHPAVNRIKLVPTDIWKHKTDDTFVCIDIGCNTGELSVELYKSLQQNLSIEDTNHLRFIGIDIDPTLISRAKEIDTSKWSLQFDCIDIMNESQLEVIKKYLQNFNKTLFNVSFCFSITMWIHLNHGDDGLKQFLKTVCDISEMVVVEPQPWKCYKTAIKRLKQANSVFPMFKELKFRQDVEMFIENVLQNDCEFVKIYETPRTEWGRRILFFERKK